MAKITVFHGFYGCDTGCCGHWVQIDDDWIGREFDFGHPKSSSLEDCIAFAKEAITEQFGEEHVKDLDWENCVVKDFDVCGH